MESKDNIVEKLARRHFSPVIGLASFDFNNCIRKDIEQESFTVKVVNTANCNNCYQVFSNRLNIIHTIRMTCLQADVICIICKKGMEVKQCALRK